MNASKKEFAKDVIFKKEEKVYMNLEPGITFTRMNASKKEFAKDVIFKKEEKVYMSGTLIPKILVHKNVQDVEI